MKLFYSPGASSLAVHIALREIDRTFELERVDLKTHRTTTGADFTQINPKGYVPALRLNGVGNDILTEVAAILQYVADLAPEYQLAPANGTFARYHLQEWLSFIGDEIHKQFGPLFHPETPAPTVERVRTKIARRFGYLDRVLADRQYLLGETFTVADAFLYVMIRWCERFDFELRRWPNLDDYFHRIAARPAVQAALVAEGLIEHKRVRHSA
jgi:glutathione S-transferase